MSQNKFRSILMWVVIVASLALAVVYVRRNIADFQSLTILQPWHLVLLVALFVITYFVIASSTRLLMAGVGLKLGYWESFGLSVMTGFYNLITPFRGGMAVRAVYLKKRHHFTYTDFISSLAGSYIITFFVSGAVGLASTLFIYWQDGVFSPIIAAIFAGATIVLLCMILIAPTFRLRGHRWLDKAIRVMNSWHDLRHDWHVVLGLAFWSLLQTIIAAWMLALQFSVFGFEITFAQALFLTSISALGFFIQVTPGGLGVSEAIIVFSAVTIGISAEQSLAAAILGRLVSVVVLFVLGPLSSWWLLKRKARIGKDDLTTKG